MPVHRSYDVTCDKEGQKLGGAVSSRKSWILPLITFFVLAGIIVTVCLLTRRPIVEHPVNDKLARNTNSNFTEYFGIRTTLDPEYNINGHGNGNDNLAPTLSPGTLTNTTPGKMKISDRMSGDVLTPTSPSGTSTIISPKTLTITFPKTTMTEFSGKSTTTTPEITTTESSLKSTPTSSETATPASSETTTTESSEIPTPASPEATTIVSPETTTTESSGKSTPASPEATTTMSPETTSTESSGLSTPASPEATMTVSPGTTTTEFAGKSTSASPEATTTVSPEATTTVSPEATTTVSPETTTTESSGISTPASPEATTTVSPEATTTMSPETTSTESSGLSTPASPEATMTVSPGTTTTESSGISTPVSPEATTTVSPETTTTESSGKSTPASPEAMTTMSSETTSTESSGKSTPASPEATTTMSPETTLTESSGLSTPASPEATTTMSPETTSTESSGKSTPASPEATTTMSPETTLTESSGLSTPASPEATTTVSPGTTTTESSGISTPASPEATTTVSPETTLTESSGLSTPASPEATTTVSPETTTTESSGKSTPASPEATTTVPPETTTTESAGKPTAASPEATTTVSPEATTTESSGKSTPASPEATTTVSPETTTTESAGKPTAASPEATTTESSGKSTPASPESTKTVSPETTSTESSGLSTPASPEATTTVSPETTTTESSGKSTPASPESTTTVSPETTSTESSGISTLASPEATTTESSGKSTPASPESTPTASPETTPTESSGLSTPASTEATTTVSPETTTTESSGLSTPASSGVAISAPLDDTGEDKNGRIDPASIEVPVDGQKYSLETREQRVNRMISYMNEAAQPCEDFYEYACGKFETSNSSISEKNLVQEVTEQIFVQAKKTTNSNVSEQFLKFYNSCVDYQQNFNKSERMKLAMEIVNEVERFEGTHNDLNFTEMLLKLFLRNSAPLFDITLDIVENEQTMCEKPSKPAIFAWKIGPQIRENTQYENKREQYCYDKQKSKNMSENVNLHHLYKGLRECKDDVNSFLDSVVKVLEELRMAESWSNKTLDIDNIKETIKFLIETFSIRVNWKNLIGSLTNSVVTSKPIFQVYVYLNEEVQVPSQISKSSLYNALFALYAHEVYDKFVVPRSEVENYCKGVTINLMKMHASSLYMSSFSSEQLMKMNATVTNMFKELRDTLKSSIMNAPIIKNTDDATIIRKIRNLTIAVPDISYYQNGSKLDPENNENKVQLTGNFLNDTIMLESNNRRSMYRLFEKSPSEDEQIWTYFAQPYQSSSSPIYALNKIILPYGIVDWATLFSDETNNATHLALATLGTHIAKEIAHHFDPTGIQYFGNVRKTMGFAAFCNDYAAQRMYPHHIEKYQQKSLTHRTSFLPSTNETVEYEITDLSLNETFSEITGLQLAYDTMLRLPKVELPWPSKGQTNARKQFFLAYAQMYCTKLPLTSSYKSFYEDEHLPSRLLISVVGSSNQFLGETWTCPKGSRMRPENISSIFPNMEFVPSGSLPKMQ